MEILRLHLPTVNPPSGNGHKITKMPSYKMKQIKLNLIWTEENDKICPKMNFSSN